METAAEGNTIVVLAKTKELVNVPAISLYFHKPSLQRRTLMP